MEVHRSDLEKIHDALGRAAQFFVHRDEMNAVLHLAPTLRLSPLASEVAAARDRLERLLLDDAIEHVVPEFGEGR